MIGRRSLLRTVIPEGIGTCREQPGPNQRNGLGRPFVTAEKSEATRRTYGSDVDIFVAWCSACGARS